MISSFFTATVFQPLYNGLILLMNVIPFADAGVIVIIFTVIIKLILFPLSIKASKAQIQMKVTEKDINAIKEKYKDDKEELSKKTIEYYKENNINPFASLFILIIQLPIIIGLYRVFLSSGLPQINTALLYTFVSVPMTVNMMFLNLINIADKSIVLAVIAGVTTYIQVTLANNSQKKLAGGAPQHDIAKAMSMQMKYVFPVIVIFISYSISAALALYWVTSNLFAIGQEIYIQKKYHRGVIAI